MSDPRLYQTPDGGEIEYLNGQITMDDGLETAAYLSVFGGNGEDSGLAATDDLQWWGNLGETDPAKLYRSQTQHLITSLPATSGNLKRIEDAANADLAWFTDEGIATVVSVSANLPGIDQLNISISIEIDGVTHPFDFPMSWKSQQ